jgi:methylmalonyl-CoA/ethylmalonyl-CoA epimerase
MKSMLSAKEKIVHLDHIAIAVKEIAKAKRLYEDLGFTFDPHMEKVEEQGVLTAFAKVEGRASIELLEPLSSESPIAKFIEKKGEGIHHLCFKVEDVEASAIELRAKGYILLYDKAQKGAHHCLVNFIHPKSTGGVLIEISQSLKE